MALHAGINPVEIAVAPGKTGVGLLSPDFVHGSVQWVEQSASM